MAIDTSKVFLMAMKGCAYEIAFDRAQAELADNPNMVSFWERALENDDTKAGEILATADVMGHCPCVLRDYLDKEVERIYPQVLKSIQVYWVLL